MFRNIPACAGKTSRVYRPARPYAEHPRVRGENDIDSLAARYSGGTSPRARGKHIDSATYQLSCRNIPACAGKTFLPRPLRTTGAEHPRVRGENTQLRIALLLRHGTSPRARGKPKRMTVEENKMRNIPACAGKTFDIHHTAHWVPEHPRVRGENDSDLALMLLDDGTSPRARGKLKVLPPNIKVERNIPACAGKTDPSFPPVNPCWEHPRVRGENCRAFLTETIQPGTSPRARGKRASNPCIRQPHRNIPACAGKTYQTHIILPHLKEHPRVRGENVRKKYTEGFEAGTSPRARGKLGVSVIDM